MLEGFKDRRDDGTMRQDVLTVMERGRIVPVVVIEDPNKAVQLGRTILDAGLSLIEITMRTEKAMEALKILNQELPQIVIGAGTIFSLATAEEAISNGARFIVSPHLDEEIVEYCARKGIVSVPGVFTPSEIQRAVMAARRGSRLENIKELPLVIKIFPASTGGPAHIAAMKAVFPDVRFLPLGGVNAGNLAEYLKAGSWAVGGTWICKKEFVDSGEFSKISELIKEARTIVASTRK